MTYLKAFVGFLLVFLIVDAIWISQVIKSLYAQEVGALLRSSPNLIAALLFYVCYAGVIVYLIKDAIGTSAPGKAFVTGAMIGLLSYGTFTVTNYSVLQHWTLILVISDMAWGTFITGLSASSAVLATRLWQPNGN